MTNEEAIVVFDLLKKTVRNQPDFVYEALDVAYEALKSAKTRGKWEPVEENGSPYWEENYGPMFLCTRCKRKSYKKPFCPHCGADMRRQTMEIEDSKYLAYLANQGIRAMYRQLALNGADQLSNEDKAVVLRAMGEHLTKKSQEMVIAEGKYFEE